MKPDETVDVNISGLPLFEVAKVLNSVTQSASYFRLTC